MWNTGLRKLTGEAPQAEEQHLPQWQIGFCHLCHQRDKRGPNRHPLTLPRQWNESGVQGLEVLDWPVLERSEKLQNLPWSIKKKKKTCRGQDWNERQTWSKGGCGFPLQKFERVQVAFLSIESLACSFNWESSGNKAPWLSTRSLHRGESPATFPNAQTALHINRWKKLNFRRYLVSEIL